MITGWNPSAAFDAFTSSQALLRELQFVLATMTLVTSSLPCGGEKNGGV
jgi:hypothetical protein